MKRTFLVECLLDRSQLPRTFALQAENFDEAHARAWEHVTTTFLPASLVSFQIKEVVDL